MVSGVGCGAAGAGRHVHGGAEAGLEQTGTLNCDVSGGIGFIIGSQRQVNCLFTPSYPAPPEQYVGTITKVGLDIGVTAAGSLVWAVHMSTTRSGRASRACPRGGNSVDRCSCTRRDAADHGDRDATTGRTLARERQDHAAR
jgi:hypothetical protein